MRSSRDALTVPENPSMRHATGRNVPVASAKGKCLLLLPCLLIGLAHGWGAETDAPKSRAAPPPQAVAAGYERAGRKAEAAAIYESLNTNAARAVTLRWQLAEVWGTIDHTPPSR